MSEPSAMPMSDQELAQIAKRVDLYATYGDRAALLPMDALALLAEVNRCRANEQHLIMMTRQHLDQLDQLGAAARAVEQGQPWAAPERSERA
jgi:hypothetical protein